MTAAAMTTQAAITSVRGDRTQCHRDVRSLPMPSQQYRGSPGAAMGDGPDGPRASGLGPREETQRRRKLPAASSAPLPGSCTFCP